LKGTRSNVGSYNFKLWQNTPHFENGIAIFVGLG